MTKYYASEIAKKIRRIKVKDKLNLAGEIFKINEKYHTKDNIYLEDWNRGVIIMNKKSKKLRGWMLR